MIYLHGLYCKVCAVVRTGQSRALKETQIDKTSNYRPSCLLMDRLRWGKDKDDRQRKCNKSTRGAVKEVMKFDKKQKDCGAKRLQKDCILVV